MGKAARNERRKIIATFLNNTGVGLTLAGAFIPMFSFMTSDLNVPFNAERVVVFSITVVTAIGVAMFLHRGALKEASQIED